MALEVNNCCFCVELRTGSLIIGYLELIWNIIVTLMVIVGMTAAGVIISQNEDEDVHTFGVIAMAAFGVVLFFVVLNFIFVVVLLVGLHKYKRGHIKAYLIYTFIFILFAIVLFISSIARSNPAGDIVRNLFNLVFSIYFFIVVRSYYLKMDEPANKPAVYNTA